MGNHPEMEDFFHATRNLIQSIPAMMILFLANSSLDVDGI